MYDRREDDYYFFDFFESESWTEGSCEKEAGRFATEFKTWFEKLTFFAIWKQRFNSCWARKRQRLDKCVREAFLVELKYLKTNWTSTTTNSCESYEAFRKPQQLVKGRILLLMKCHCSIKYNIVFSPKSQQLHVGYSTTNPTMQCFPFYSWDLQITVRAKLQLSAEMLTINWLKENPLDVRIVNKSHVRHDSSDTTFPRMQWKLSGEHVWTCGIEKKVKTWNRTSVF